MLNRKEIAANVLLLLVIILNTGMRYFDQTIFVYGNIAALTLLSIAIILISRGINKSLGILLLGYFISLGIDKLAFTTYELQANDFIFLTGWLIAAVDYSRGWLKQRWDGNSIILLIALLIKVYSQNSLDLVGERYIFYMGDAFTYFLLGLYIARVLIKKTQFIPLLFLAAAFNNLQDNLVGDPYDFHLNELYFMGWVVISLTWWELRKKFGKTPQARKHYNAAYVTLNVLLVGYVAIEVLRYIFLF